MEARLAESDRRHAESLAAVQQGMNAQMQALTQSMQALVSQISAKPAGPDPTIMLLLESQKQQAEAQRETARLMADAQKETARLQADAQREAARTALGPRELIELMTRQSGNQEHIIQASRAAIDIMKESVDAALNMRGGDAHPALAMVQEGLTNTMQLAQHYISSKSQTEAVKANSAAVQAQAVAQTAQANAFAASQRPPAINGASPVVPAIEPPSAEPEEEEDDDETETKPGPGLKLTPEETEQQLFGPALEAVQRLRIGVKTKIIIPSQASAAVLQGISHFARLGQRVPAFDLVRAREYGKLVDILLPDSDLAFKEQMIDGLVPALEQMANNGTPPPAGAQVATGAAA